MYPPHLSYLNEKGIAWFNPSYALNGFWNEYRKVSERIDKPFDYVWRHRDLKRAKEIYSAAILAKAMEKSTGETWWIYKPKNDPPDAVVGTIIQKNGFQEMHVREVEIVEHFEGNILDTIRKKLSGRKQYEPNTVLVCYISRGVIFDPKKVSEEILRETTSLDHVLLAFPGLPIANVPLGGTSEEVARALFKISSIQIKPVFSYINIDPIADCKDWREGREGSFFIFEGRGKSGTRPITLDSPPQLF